MPRQLKFSIIIIAGLMMFSAGCVVLPDRPHETPQERPVDAPVDYDKQDGNHYFNYILAQREKGQGRLDSAIVRLNRAVEAKPEDIALIKELISFYIQNNNYEEALRLSDSVLESHPDDSAVLIIGASIRQELGHQEEAAALLEKVITVAPERERVYLVLGDIYLRKGEVEKAVAVYEKMSQQFPNKWDVYFMLGRAYDQQGRFEAAESNFKKCLSLEPGLLSPRFALAELYKKKWAANAEVPVEKNDTLYSLCQNFYGACGSVLIEKIAEANPEIKNLSNITPGQTLRFPHRHQQTDAFYSDIIVDIYKSILADYPDEHRASLELALYYQEIGRIEKAEELLMALGQKSVDDKRIVQYVNQLYLESGQYEPADLIISGMLKGAPDHSALHYLKGMLFSRRDDLHQALDHFSKIDKNSDVYRHARLQTALLYEETGQPQKATDLFDELIAEEPDNAELLFYAGVFYERQEEKEKAEKLYQRGIALDPMNAELHYRLGVLKDKAGEKETVIEHMKTVLQIDPDDANALNYLGYTYAEMGINLDEARELIEKAMELEPDNGYIIDSLGWVYFQMGDIGKAIKYLEEAVGLLPDDPVLLDHLGDAYAENGDLEKALKYYRQSLEQIQKEDDPDLQEKAKVQKKIDALIKGGESP